MLIFKFTYLYLWTAQQSRREIDNATIDQEFLDEALRQSLEGFSLDANVASAIASAVTNVVSNAVSR
jgi:hypothetical protein